jgi:F0F1-type ATP synthase assembly protein I
MKNKSANKGIVFFGVAFELVALCIGGWILGGMIDQHMKWVNTAQTYLVLTLLVGWFIHLFYLLRKFEKDNASDDLQ